MNIGVIGINKHSVGLIDFLKKDNHISVYETKKKLKENGISKIDGVVYSDPEIMVKRSDLIFISELTPPVDNNLETYYDLENTVLGVGNWAWVYEHDVVVVITSVLRCGGFEKYVKPYAGKNLNMVFCPAPNLNPFSYSSVIYHAENDLSKVVFDELLNKYKLIRVYSDIRVLEAASFLHTQLTKDEVQKFINFSSVAYQLT